MDFDKQSLALLYFELPQSYLLGPKHVYGLTRFIKRKAAGVTMMGAMADSTEGGLTQVWELLT